MRALKHWPVGLLLLALAAVFGPFVASGGLLAVGDGLGYYFPVRALAAVALRQGEWPFWNPAGFAGVPLHGMLQAGVLYPLNWGFVALPPVAAMNLDVLGSVLLAGLGMWALTRAWGLGAAAGLVAALPYMFAGYGMAHLEQLTSVQVVSLIPWLLWAVERFRQTRRARWALAFSLLYASQLLAGYPQTSLFSLLIAWSYGAYRGRDLAWAAWRPYMAQLTLGGGLGLLAAAVQLLPVIGVIQQSTRLALSYPELVEHSLPLHQLPMFWFPFMFGGPHGPLFGVPYWGVGPYVIELQGYAGLLPWMLALVALCFWRFDARVRYFTGLGLVGGLLALGGNTPIFHLWARLPILHSIRVPGRHVLEVDLALCALAALGLQYLLDAPAPVRRRLVGVGAGAIAAAMLGVLAALALGRGRLVAKLTPWLPPGFDLGWALSLAQPAFWVPLVFLALGAAALTLAVRRPRLGAAAVVLALFLDVATFARAWNWNVTGGHPGPLAMALPDSPYRSIAVTLGVPMHDYPLAYALHAPLLSAFRGERSASGYEAFVPRRYGALLGGIDNMGLYHAGGPFQAPNHALDLLGVRYAYVDPAMAGTRYLPTFGPGWQRRPDAPRARVYENTRALPRGWRVAAAQVLASAAVDARVMTDPAFDPGREALLETGALPASLAPGPVTVTPRSPNRLAVTTRGTGAGLVVVSERYEPGWTATTADGRDLPVRAADGLVLAVDVPAGDQAFELRYRPPGWGKMVMASLLGVVGWLLWAVGACFLRRPPAERGI